MFYIINILVIAHANDHYALFPKIKDHLLGVLVKILRPKKQIRYKRHIRDTLDAYTERYIATKV